jgi:hypothetical protein
MERWLRRARYSGLAEIVGDFVGAEGAIWRGPFSLAPEQPGSFELITSLYDELLPHFSSPFFNVGLDETFDLGAGKSKQLCEARGTGRVYLDFLWRVYEAVRARGRTMQYWGDVILHHPELIAELPKDAIALEWGYEASHPFADHAARFQAAGLPYYVCPGTSSWNSLAGRTDNALANLSSAAENGLKFGAAGYLITDWGDNGHWQPLPVSYLGLAMGAAYSWALEANRHLNVAAAIGRFAFDDPGGAFGRLAHDLGNVYRLVGREPLNSSVLFNVLQWPLATVRRRYGEIAPERFQAARQAIEATAAMLPQTRSSRPDADLMVDEYDNVIRLLAHACRRAHFAIDPTTAGPAELEADLRLLVNRYQALWLQRNRPGGLVDSVGRFEKALADYVYPVVQGRPVAPGPVVASG